MTCQRHLIAPAPFVFHGEQSADECKNSSPLATSCFETDLSCLDNKS